jgi:hypothetical protein
VRILHKLNEAEAFEKFLHTKYVGHKRFGLEGSESLIPLLDAVIDAAAATGMEEVVFGMAHRGRLNVLSNVIGKSPERIFREFEGDLDPETTGGSGDVKYHLGAGASTTPSRGPSPSKWWPTRATWKRWIPVLEGVVRAKQERRGRRATTVLPVLIHGDAAFAGQGVVVETLHLSQLRGLPHRRHRPRRHQQPGGLHHLGPRRPVELLRHRRRQDRPGPHHPRQRGRPRGGDTGGPAGLRLPPGFPQGRGHRPHLPTAAGVTTRETSPPTRSRSCTS